MRAINQKEGQKGSSPGRCSTDLYILCYGQNDINLIRNREALCPALPARPLSREQESPSPHPLRRDGQHPRTSVADRWKHIDRLVERLKRGPKSKDKDVSACGRLFALVEKVQARLWRQNSRQVQQAAFRRIQDQSHTTNRFARLFNLKESLEMRENEIQKGSKNFELNDLMHIVDLHQKDPSDTRQQKLKNSLSREMILREEEVRGRAPSPKKVSKNVYILRRKTKEDLSTRQDLNSNTHISSEQFLPPGMQTARSISPHSVDRSRSPNSVGDAQIELPETHSERENKLQELEINSVKLDKSQEPDQEGEAISKMGLPSFGMNRPSQVAPARSNRLMDPSAPQRKIIFHYKNSQEKSISPVRNEYFPPETAAKFILPRQVIAKNTGTLPVARKMQIPHQDLLARVQQPTRLQRISSLQALHPKSIVSHHSPSGVIAQGSGQVGRKEDEGSIQPRRCYSMPKITFSYKSREDPFANPSPPQNILKNSPIFVLNQLKSSNPMAKQPSKEDPYLSKNIQVTNIPRFPCDTRPSSFLPPKTLAYPANIQAENHYSIPVNNFALNPVIPHPRPQRLKIFSNYQAQQASSQQVRREDYYGVKEEIPTQETLPSASRQRVMSTDTYILTKPRINPQAAANLQSIPHASVERGRARSCGIKMEVVSRRQPMIRVC